MLIRKDNKENWNVPAFMTAVSANSFADNSDGEGIYWNGRLVRSLRKINPITLPDIHTSTVILSHQRLATSGKTAKYTQPFLSNFFVFMHNGVMSDFEKGNHSDTYILFKKFRKFFSKTPKDMKREKRIHRAIKKLFDNVDGRFSISIYDKEEDKIYYFKDSGTNIYCYENHDFLYITTNSSNVLMLDMLQVKFTERELKPYQIYVIEPKTLKIKWLGRIKEKSFRYTQPKSTWEPQEYVKGVKQAEYDDEDDADSKARSSDEVWKDEFATMASTEPCKWCREMTQHIELSSNDRVCEECWLEMREYMTSTSRDYGLYGDPGEEVRAEREAGGYI